MIVNKLMPRCIAKTPCFSIELASGTRQESSQVRILERLKSFYCKETFGSKSPRTNPAFRSRVNEKGFLILKVALWGLTGIFVFANSLFLNVLVHEWGHYVAAEQYGLEPKIELNFEKVGELGFGLESIPLASTSFIDNGDEGELRVIVLMGPFMNLLMGIAFLVFFVFLCGRKIVEEIGLIGMVVSFGSFVMNMLPFEGADGSLIFGVI